MGDPKHPKKKYQTPKHPWQKARIDEEKILVKEYGLKNKREIWKMKTLLRNFTRQAKRVVTKTTPQFEKEKLQLLTRLQHLGLLSENTQVNDVLSLHLKNILDRRLQTFVYKKNLARSVKQARQFIVHEHIMVNNQKITSPGFLVPKMHEGTISFSSVSSLASPDHPEREILERKPKKRKVKMVRPMRRRR